MNKPIWMGAALVGLACGPSQAMAGEDGQDDASVCDEGRWNTDPITLIAPRGNPYREIWAQVISDELEANGIHNELVLMGWSDSEDPCGGIVPRTFGGEAPRPGYADCGFDALFVGYGLLPDGGPGDFATNARGSDFTAWYGFQSDVVDWLYTQWQYSQSQWVRDLLFDVIQWTVYVEVPAAQIVYPAESFYVAPGVDGFDPYGRFGTAYDITGLAHAVYAVPYVFFDHVPYISLSYGEATYIDAVFTGLVQRGPVPDLQVLPSLATDWSVSSDGLTWTIHLRTDAVWQTNDAFPVAEPVTADDVLFSWQVAEDFGQVLPGYFANVYALDDYTVVAELTAPDPLFARTVMAAKIVPEHAFWDPAFATQPIGYGPYTLDNIDYLCPFPDDPEFCFGIGVELSRWDGYHISGGPDSLEVQTWFGSGADAIAQIGNGIDIVDAQFQVHGPQPGAVEIPFKGLGRQELSFNSSGAQRDFANHKVRQAVSHLIDRPWIAQELMGGYATQGASYVAPAQIGYNEDIPPRAFSPAKAAYLMSEAGYECE